MRITLSSLLFLACATAGLCQTPEAAIRKVLDQQALDWNRGDIRAFMTSYTDDALYVGKEVTRGAAKVQARYLQRYPNKDAMGETKFTDVEVHLLGTDHAYVIGRYYLTRSTAAGGNTNGIFSLVFRKTAAGWKIILDHTAELEPAAVAPARR